jgi:hypothetical protein
MIQEYHTFKSFENIYLEDSYLLDVDISDTKITLTVEAVLTEEHSQYSEPEKEKKYCYQIIDIIFSNVTSYAWNKKNMHLISGGDVAPDYGNIDFFYKEKAQYNIGGEWGTLQIRSNVPQVLYT